MLRVVVPSSVLVVFVYGLVDVIRTDARLTKGISKPAWIVVQIVLPVIGAILWFLIGRPREHGPVAGSTATPPHRMTIPISCATWKSAAATRPKPTGSRSSRMSWSQRATPVLPAPDPRARETQTPMTPAT